MMCFGLNYGVGGHLSGLKIGVVNDEVSSNECMNSSLETFEIQRFDCILQKTSCRFIRNFDQEVAELVRIFNIVKSF
jgi:hypothetical protein